jgi:hypothetical protein
MRTAVTRLERAFARLMVVRTDAESVEMELAALGESPLPRALLDAMLAPSEPGEPYSRARDAVLAALPASVAPEAKAFLAQTIARRRAVRAVAASLAAGLLTDPARVEAVFQATYRALWAETVVLLPDPSLSGDQIIDTIARQVPPRAHASIMGIQNIKGTGLDFVYRWVSIDTTTRALALVASGARADRERGMRDLMLHDDYGLVDAALVLAKIEEAREADREGESHRYGALLTRLEGIVAARTARLTSRTAATASERVRAFIGKTFDYLDSIRRQRMARAVEGDLVAGYVSHAAAAVRMRDVVARAKGAWMTRRE